MTQLFAMNTEKLHSFMSHLDDELNIEYQKSDTKSEKYGFDF